MGQDVLDGLHRPALTHDTVVGDYVPRPEGGNAPHFTESSCAADSEPENGAGFRGQEAEQH